MKLSNIINKIECKVIGSKRRNITSLTHIASEATKNSIFFCLNGKVTNGINFVDEAVKNGARVIVTQTSVSNNKLTQIIVPDVRKAMSLIASIFYGEPASKLKIIGVTGTNGKTTTTDMIAHVLSQKYKVGIIGTNGATFNNTTIATGFTTPDPIILFKLFSQMVENGVEYVVMEFSAHAIYLQKLWGIMCGIVAFTNLSQDHLDYFDNMENYFNAKLKLFTEANYKKAVVCIDTDYGKQIANGAKNVITCSSKSNDADIFVSNIEHTTANQSFTVSTKSASGKFSLGMLGAFNIQNAVVAISVCLGCNFTMDEIANSLATLKGVEGRFNCYSSKSDFTVILDYAHTPDGLKNLLLSAREIAGKNKLISVFGCGGNRDTEKRPIMGYISESIADYTIITTDNPRFEDNYKIAEDIVKGFTKKHYEIVLDRGQALRKAVSMAKKGDVVVLAGKGAENYMDVNGTKIEYSDKDLIKRVLQIN